MDISTGHMVLAYMEDHLKNKQRLEQEWVGLCGYEAEPSSTTVAFKAENKKKNRYPDKLPYDHNRYVLSKNVKSIPILSHKPISIDCHFKSAANQISFRKYMTSSNDISNVAG